MTATKKVVKPETKKISANTPVDPSKIAGMPTGAVEVEPQQYIVLEKSFVNGQMVHKGDLVQLPEGVEPGSNLKAVTDSTVSKISGTEFAKKQDAANKKAAVEVLDPLNAEASSAAGDPAPGAVAGLNVARPTAEEIKRAKADAVDVNAAPGTVHGKPLSQKEKDEAAKKAAGAGTHTSAENDPI